MASSTIVIGRSGSASRIEGSGSVAVDDAREVRVAAPEDQVFLCRKGSDLLVNFKGGETARLVHFFQDDPAAMPQLLFQAPHGGGYQPYSIPDGPNACFGLIIPIPGQTDGSMSEATLAASILAAAFGGFGLAVLGDEDEEPQGNRPPLAGQGVTTGALSESADGASGENVIILKAEGEIPFSDPDEKNVHRAIVRLVSAEDSAGGAVSEHGTFASTVAKAAGATTGTVTWTFELPDSAIDYLAAGQTITQIYEITIDDGAGGTAREQVTVTITGTNDAPVVQAVSRNIDADADPIVISADFSDVDLLDTHSFFIDTDGTLGQVTNNGDGTFTYDPNGAFDHLGPGGTATDTFTYTVRDSSGADATETVTVNIVNSSQAPNVPDVTLQRSTSYEFGFDPAPDFEGWTVDRTHSGPGSGTVTTTAGIDRSGTLITGDDAVAVLTLRGDHNQPGLTNWGPTISSAPVTGRAGDIVEVNYVLHGGTLNSNGDTAHVRISILDADTGAVVQQIQENAPQGGSTTGPHSVTLNRDGEFIIRIELGSTDDDRGLILGGRLELGHVRYETDLLASDKTYMFDKSEFLASASDPDGDPLDITSVSSTSASGATVFIGTDGRIHYDPTSASFSAGQETVDTFQFTVSDGRGGVTTATARVSVMGVPEGVTTTPTAGGVLDSLLPLIGETDGIFLADESLSVDQVQIEHANGSTVGRFAYESDAATLVIA